MNIKSLSPSPLSPIPSWDNHGSGVPLHFLHANGYPPACYQPLLSLLSQQYHVMGMYLRPLWPDARPDGLSDWQPYSDDLLQFLEEQRPGPVIGMGHSIGATVSLRAALQQPDRFKALVLLDPVLFPKGFMLQWNVIRSLGLGYRLHPLIPAALKRRRRFDDLETVFSGYRRRRIFRYFSDDHLRAFIAGMTEPAPGGGYQLAYSPEWEAHIYYTGVWHDWDLWRHLNRLQPPALVIRGAETDTFWASTAKKVAAANPRIKIVTLEKSTHLLPLEKPQEVFEIMQHFLKEVL